MYYTFGLTCFLLVGLQVVWVMEWKPADDKPARLRVSVQDRASCRELPITYDKRWVETVKTLIESEVFSKQMVDSLEPSGRRKEDYLSRSSLRDAARIVNRTLRVTSLEGTSLIDLHYPDNLSSTDVTVGRIAGFCQEYWRRRSPKDIGYKVRVEVLDTATSKADSARRAVRAYGAFALMGLRDTLLVLTGTICAALLTRKPRQLYLLLAGAFLYVIVLLVTLLPTTFTPGSYAATCLVHAWPFDASLGNGDRPRPASRQVSPLDGQCELALPEKVLARTLEVMDEDSVFLKAERRQWETMSPLQKEDWLKQRLQVFPLADSFLMQFTALDRYAVPALELCNSAALAYTDLRPQLGEQDESDDLPFGLEIVGPATISHGPGMTLNPIADALLGGLARAAWFMAGAGIGYLGFLIRRIRLSKRREDATGDLSSVATPHADNKRFGDLPKEGQFKY
jgi:hypothetical protein